jgi:tetratricopeptide (TPR) repeat protein
LELVLINLFWQSTDSSLYLPTGYRVFVTGSVVSGETTLETWLTSAQWVQVVRYALVGSAVLAALAALGLFLRLSRSHTLAVILIVVQIVLAAALPLMGFSGYFLTLLRVVFTVVLAALLLQTVEELVKEERREWLETDRTCVTAMDYYTQGHFYARQGMWAKALLHWQMALSEGVEDDRDSYFASMARAWAALGRYEQALEHIDEAMRVSPTPQKWEPLRETLAQARRRAGGQR